MEVGGQKIRGIEVSLLSSYSFLHAERKGRRRRRTEEEMGRIERPMTFLQSSLRSQDGGKKQRVKGNGRKTPLFGRGGGGGGGGGPLTGVFLSSSP